MTCVPDAQSPLKINSMFPRTGASFRANLMSIHAEMTRYKRDGWMDRQMAFELYIVDSLHCETTSFCQIFKQA